MIYKHKVSNVIIFLTFLLCLLHTFTFLQIYYNFFATVGLFVLILMLYILGTEGKMKIKENYNLFFLYIAIVLMVIVSFVIKEKDIVTVIGTFLPLLIWPTLYSIVVPLMTNKEKSRFIYCFLIFFMISVLATFSVVIVDNDAARLLAGAASEAERSSYYKQGVGGYGFVYGSVFFIFGMIILGSKSKNIVKKVLLYGATMLTFLMIVFSSYTIAIMMALMLFFLAIYARTKKKNATYIFIGIFILLLFFLGPILALMHEMAENMDLYWLSKRTGQLLAAKDSGGFSDLKRIQLYMQSFNSFLDNPVFGGNSIGGHSMFFDSIGEYGLVGIVYFLAILAWLNKRRKDLKNRVGVVYFCVMFLLIINTMDSIVLLPMIMFILPMLLSLSNELEGINEEGIAY